MNAILECKIFLAVPSMTLPTLADEWTTLWCTDPCGDVVIVAPVMMVLLPA